MKLPNLKHLHYLVVLYEEQHFHRAASKCHVNQSTLSAAILTLEDQLQCQLLERDNKTFSFTPLGVELVNKAEHLLLQSREWVEYAQSQGQWDKGQLRLGIIPTIAPFLLTDMVTCFAQQLPHIQLELLEDTTQSLLELLGRGQLDLLLLALPIPTPGCRQRIIGRDPFHLVTHVDSLKHLDERVTLDNLPNAKVFLLQQEHCLTEHAISACSLENHSQVSHFYASSLHSLVQMCCVKEGVTFLPNMALKKGILADYPLTALPAEPHAFREIGLVWRNSTTRIQLFHYIASMLTDLVPEPIS